MSNGHSYAVAGGMAFPAVGDPLDRYDPHDDYVPDPPPAWQQRQAHDRVCGTSESGERVGGCGRTITAAAQRRPDGAAPGLGALWHPDCLRAEVDRREGVELKEAA